METIPTGQEHTQQPCLYQVLYNSYPGTLALSLGLAITGITLLLLLQRISRRAQPHLARHPDQMDGVEKGTTSPSTSPPPPPASACDVLKPLSQSGAFPSSGAVAARAREQMQTGKASPSSPGTSPSPSSSPNPALKELEGGDNLLDGSVQKRSEMVQQMREVDVEGVRTWRRVVIEYN